MHPLPNGCTRSSISVTPKNWSTAKAPIKKAWRIHYRFYDPAFKDNPELWGKQVLIRSGINRLKDLAQRQQAVKALIEKEIDLLDVQGYNPITEKFIEIAETIEEINPSTPFISALRKARNMLTVCHEMKIDMDSAIRGMEEAAGKLYDKTLQKTYNALKIDQVRRRHLVYLFQQCKKDSDKFSANRQNKYRAYLIMLFKQLLQVEAVDANPANDLAIEKVIQAQRELLTDAERIIINANVQAWDYPFWRFMRIFHRSGSRTTEMLAVQISKVNLEEQEFRVLVKKGRQYVEQTRPIPDDILPLWQEVMSEAKAGDYLFSTGMKPGPKKTRRQNVMARWRRYVKNDPGVDDPQKKGYGLGIKKDWYSLKALNADQLDDQLDIEHAAAADGHTNTTTTKKHYAINHEKRRLERLKRERVDFI